MDWNNFFWLLDQLTQFLDKHSNWFRDLSIPVALAYLWYWFRRPKIVFNIPEIGDWDFKDNHIKRKAITVEVENKRNVKAKGCVATIVFLFFPDNSSHVKGKKYCLHWADDPYSLKTTGENSVTGIGRHLIV